MESQDHIAREILAELARRRMPHSELAKQIGMDVNSLSARLNEKRAFRLHEVTAIAEVFGMTTSELVARAEDAWVA